MAGSYSAAAKRELISLTVIVTPMVRAKKLVSVEDAPTALLRGDDKYPRMLMVSGLIENDTGNLVLPGLVD